MTVEGRLVKSALDVGAPGEPQRASCSWSSTEATFTSIWFSAVAVAHFPLGQGASATGILAFVEPLPGSARELELLRDLNLLSPSY